MSKVHNSTALNPAQWLALAATKHGAYVLIDGDHVDLRDQYLKVMGRFTQDSATHPHLRVMSHTDYVQQLMRRTAEALVVS